MVDLAVRPIDDLYRDESVAMGEHEGVFVIVWRRCPTRPLLERATEVFADSVARAPGPRAMLGVIEPTSPPPALVDLPYCARSFDRFASVFDATAAVLEHRAPASKLLDVCARIGALRRRAVPTKFCADVAEASAWLAIRHAHPSADATFRADLADAVERIRARLPPFAR